MNSPARLRNLRLTILLCLVTALLCTEPITNYTEPPTLTFLPQNPKYPKEVYRIFSQMPEYEFYEPKLGRQFGFVENEALFPSEVDLDKTIYFRKSKAPPCGYKGYKYVPLCYHYSKNLKAKTLEGNPIFVAHYVLVPQSFNDEIQNYMQLPVYNPIAETEVMITVERTLREYQQVKPIMELTIHKDPNGLSTPQLSDPMLKPIKLVGKKDDPGKKGNTQQGGKKPTKGTPQHTKTTKSKQPPKKKAPVLPTNKKTGKPYTPKEWKLELGRRTEAEKKRVAREKAFMQRIDFGLIFPAAADSPTPKPSRKSVGSSKHTDGHKSEQKHTSNKNGKQTGQPQQKHKNFKVHPATGLRIVHSEQEEKRIGNGGFTKGPNTPKTHYFQNKTVVSSSLKTSPYYPPFNMEMPTIPSDAITDPAEIGHALIARYIPPKPLIRGMKYTYFFLAPAKFKFPKDVRVYVPVYILVPRTETHRPSDMTDMLFDHFVTGNDQFGEDLLMLDPESKILHTIIATTPRKIPLNSHEVLKSKFYLETPMKVMSRKNFLTKDEFSAFLIKENLINPPDLYFESKKKSTDSLIGDSNTILNYLKKMFYFKDSRREQIIKDAVTAAKKEAQKRYDIEQEMRLRMNRTEFDRDLIKAVEEEKTLQYQEMLIKHEVEALRQILNRTNPASPLLRPKTKKPSALSASGSKFSKATKKHSSTSKISTSRASKLSKSTKSSSSTDKSSASHSKQSSLKKHAKHANSSKTTKNRPKTDKTSKKQQQQKRRDRQRGRATWNKKALKQLDAESQEKGCDVKHPK